VSLVEQTAGGVHAAFVVAAVLSVFAVAGSFFFGRKAIEGAGAPMVAAH
jgi:hypothetical protein